MNLVPIDPGGTVPELIVGEASPGGDFAALMSGLMSGDTQIVPIIDLPVGEQLPPDSESPDADETTEIGASILEFIGTPPAGLAISSPPAEAPPKGVAATTEPPAVLIEGEPASAPAPAPALDQQALGQQIASPSLVHAGIDTVSEPTLATVHPISTHLENAAQSATLVAGIVDAGRSGQEQRTAGPVPLGTAAQTAQAPNETAPRAASPSTETGAPPTQSPRSGADPLGRALDMTSGTVDTSSLQRHIDAGNPPESRTEPTPGEAQVLRPDVELDTGASTRPLEPGRPAGAISQPVMVGVARRVEEAIAALAAKPDPKIVTLQLDELDGLRLTVALRPDGIHLSSSGDTALTTEIERALASRGFDMASGGDEGRRRSEEPADDGWRPQPTNRRRPTDQPGIRL